MWTKRNHKGTAAAALFVSHTIIHNAYTAINLDAAESDSTNSVGKDYLARLVLQRERRILWGWTRICHISSSHCQQKATIRDPYTASLAVPQSFKQFNTYPSRGSRGGR